MTIRETLKWFEELSAASGSLIKQGGMLGSSYDAHELSAWTTEASAAIASVFPPGHQLREEWQRAILAMEVALHGMAFSGGIKRTVGAFAAAHSMIKAGRIASLVDGVRAETVVELLDQADDLVEKNYLIAATVVAGGALETFLHFLCEKNQLTWQGHGSIEKYKNALVQDPPALDKGDGKAVTTWGDLRNKAAHTPNEFNRSAEEVRIMIAGIREFINRVSRQ